MKRPFMPAPEVPGRLFVLCLALILSLSLLSGCASMDDAYCDEGMALRKVGGTYVCQGFGDSFSWKIVTPPRAPWWRT